MTHKVLRSLHLLGLVLFLGSIFGHVAVGWVPGAADDPATLLVARQVISVATAALTLPGLLLLVLTGVALLFGKAAGFVGQRWVILHLTLGLLIALNGGLVLYPLGQELLTGVSGLAAGDPVTERIATLQGREALFGALNVGMSLLALFVAVLKPRFGRSRA